MKLPAAFVINRANFIDNTNYVSSDSRSLNFRQRKTVGQRYEIRATSIRLQRDELKPVMAGIAAINRDNATVEFLAPLLSESNAETKQTAQDRAIGQYAINLSNTADISIGDMFTFSGHTKAYQVTAINGIQIEFSPNLVRPVSTGETVKFNGMEFTCKLRGRPQQFNCTGNDDSVIVEIDLVEYF